MRYYLILCAAIFSILSGEYVLASENSTGITISPAVQDIVFDEDSATAFVQTIPLTVTNNTTDALDFNIDVIGFQVSETGNGIRLMGDDDKLTQEAWHFLELPEHALRLEPGKSIVIPVKVNGEGLSAGAHYGAIRLRSIVSGQSTEELRSQDPVVLEQVLTSLFFVKKEGGSVYKQEVDTVEVQRNLLQFPTSVMLDFRNDGNVYTVPRGFISIRNSRGIEVARTVINSESQRVFPGLHKTFSISMHPFKSIFIPGRYTVSVNTRHDDTDEFIVIDERIFVLPVVTLIVLLAGVGSIGMVWFRKKVSKASARVN